MRPFVTWSRVEKRFASRKGGSNEVDAVIPKAKFVVTYIVKDKVSKVLQRPYYL